MLVTTQLMIFGNYRFNHTKYYHDNHIAFEHLFLKDWDAVREINAYPPATGILEGRSFSLGLGQSVNDIFSQFPFQASMPSTRRRRSTIISTS